MQKLADWGHYYATQYVGKPAWDADVSIVLDYQGEIPPFDQAVECLDGLNL
jgi:hypothetical protein